MDDTPPILGWVLLSDRGGMPYIHVRIVMNASGPLIFCSAYLKFWFSACKPREIVFEEYVLSFLIAFFLNEVFDPRSRCFSPTTRRSPCASMYRGKVFIIYSLSPLKHTCPGAHAVSTKFIYVSGV